MQTFKKNISLKPIREDAELRGCANFDPKEPICLQKTVFRRIINTIFMCLLAPFNVQNWVRSGSGALRMHYNFESRMTHLPQAGIFFEKTLI